LNALSFLFAWYYCREVAYEYSEKIRGLARKLLEGISESLGLASNSIIESTEFDSSHQLFVVNLYPPCPQPHLALGMPSHSDTGLLTLLTQNGIGGLQVKHHAKWVNVNPLPNCLTVLLADHLEVCHVKKLQKNHILSLNK